MKTALSTQADTFPFLGGGPQALEGPPGLLAQPAASAVTAGQVQALAEACWQESGRPRQLLESWAQTGLDWDDIYLQGVVPAAQLLGAWWLSDRMDFAAVSIASTRLQQTLYALSPTFLGLATPAANGLSALLFCSPGSQHSMGVFMLGEFFRKSGWRVCGLPLEGPVAALRCVQSDWFDVLGLSVSTDRCMDTVGRLIQDLRAASANPDLKIMVGGPMVALNRGLLLSLGADFIGGDARESQRLASQYVKKDPRCKGEYSPCNTTIDTVNRIPVLTVVQPQSSEIKATNKTITQPNRWR